MPAGRAPARAAALAVSLAGFAAASVFALSVPVPPVENDAVEYLSLARNVAGGAGFTADGSAPYLYLFLLWRTWRYARGAEGPARGFLILLYWAYWAEHALLWGDPRFGVAVYPVLVAVALPAGGVKPRPGGSSPRPRADGPPPGARGWTPRPR